MQYMTRLCWKCEVEKPVSAFHQQRPGVPKRVCAECRNREKRETRAVQTAAHKAVERALGRGDLVRPEACSGCGAVGPTDGHHDDYSKPLDVRWLCRSCHKTLHGREGREPRARRKVDVRLPAVLLDAVDASAEELGQTRTKFMERALEKALGSSRPVRVGQGDGAGLADSPVRGPSRPPAESKRATARPSLADTWRR